MLDPGHSDVDAHNDHAGVDSPELDAGHYAFVAQREHARVNTLDPGHLLGDTQAGNAGVNHLAPDQARPAAQGHVVGGDSLAGSHPRLDAQRARASGADALLSLLAEALDDLERVRISTENRLRSLEQVHGLAGTGYAKSYQAMLETFAAAERRAVRDLERGMAAHPLAPFVQSRKGLGLKGTARLLAAIGNPADRPNPAKLWQYCGHGDPARSRRRKGEQTAYSPNAKTRLWQVAESASRQGHYRDVYVAAREACADKVHTVECRNHVRPPGRSNGCGTSIHPEWGEVGSPWRDGHKHAHALRIVGKTILLDMWKYAREVEA